MQRLADGSRVGEVEEGKRKNGNGRRLDLGGVRNTQYNIQMMYYKIVHKKHIILLTSVTPISSINKKLFLNIIYL